MKSSTGLRDRNLPGGGGSGPEIWPQERFPPETIFASYTAGCCPRGDPERAVHQNGTLSVQLPSGLPPPDAYSSRAGPSEDFQLEYLYGAVPLRTAGSQNIEEQLGFGFGDVFASGTGADAEARRTMIRPIARFFGATRNESAAADRATGIDMRDLLGYVDTVAVISVYPKAPDASPWPVAPGWLVAHVDFFTRDEMAHEQSATTRYNLLNPRQTEPTGSSTTWEFIRGWADPLGYIAHLTEEFYQAQSTRFHEVYLTFASVREVSSAVKSASDPFFSGGGLIDALRARENYLTELTNNNSLNPQHRFVRSKHDRRKVGEFALAEFLLLRRVICERG